MIAYIQYSIFGTEGTTTSPPGVNRNAVPRVERSSEVTNDGDLLYCFNIITPYRRPPMEFYNNALHVIKLFSDLTASNLVDISETQAVSVVRYSDASLGKKSLNI